MRKRIVIGLLAIAAIGVAAFLISQPKPGTVEWHKAEYLATESELMGQKWFTPFEQAYCKITKKPWRPRAPAFPEVLKVIERNREHWGALHASGYLAVQRFTITNRSRFEVASWAWTNRVGELSREQREFTMFTYPESDTNMLVLVAPRDDMPRWEELIRKALIE